MNVYFLISVVSNFFLFCVVIYFSWLLNESYKWRSVLEEDIRMLQDVNCELKSELRRLKDETN